MNFRSIDSTRLSAIFLHGVLAQQLFALADSLQMPLR
jgi:hypothetical protein